MDLFERAMHVFETVCDGPSEQRQVRVDELCHHDWELRREVEALLRADGQGSFLDATVSGVPDLISRVVHDMEQPDYLGEYRIIRELGRGGMGVVYEAEQDHPRRRVALKTLPVLGFSQAAKGRFRVEVQALGQVLHPGIPQLYEVFEVDGRPVLAMELVQGERIDSYARQRPPVEIAQLVESVARAVEHAHSCGVVHRDIKPSNILVGSGGQPKILDFGIASLDGENDETVGTPAYMAPEQVDGSAVDARSDVYALGMLARELLADVALRRVDLQAILRRATQRDPNERYPSAATFADDLGRWRAFQPVRAAARSPVRALGWLVYRHRVLVGLALVAAAVGSLALLATQSWMARVADDRVEQDARERWSVVRALQERGDVDDERAVEAFHTFVQDPTWSGTAAVADAWSWWAHHRTDPTDRGGALIQAWSVAPAGAKEQRARADLIEHQHVWGRWAATAKLLRGMDGGGPKRARFGVAAWAGDLETLEDELDDDVKPLLALLRIARRDRSYARRQLVWTGRSRLASTGDRIWREDVDGTVLEELGLPSGVTNVDLLRRGASVLVQSADAGTARWTPGVGQTELQFVHQPQLDRHVESRHADGSEIRVDKWDDRLVVTQSIGAGISLSSDDVGDGYDRGVSLLDLDGDARQDLLYGTMGWRHTGLQVWTVAADGATLKAHRPAPVYGISQLTSGVIALIDAPIGTVPDHHRLSMSQMRSLRLVKLIDGELQAGPSLLTRPKLSGVVRGDFDGDGRMDLVVSGDDAIWVLRRTESDDWAILELPGLRSAMVVQSDSDEADELWVMTSWGEPGWLLGHAGGEPFAGVQSNEQVVAPIPAPQGATGGSVERWRRADELVVAGLLPEAKAVFRSLGNDPSAIGATSLVRAMELASLRDGPGSPPVGQQVGLAHDVLAHAASTAEQRDLASKLLSANHVFRDEQWVGSRWRPVRHDAVRTSLGSTRLELVSGTSDVATIEQQRTSGPVGVELDVRFDDLDWSAGLELELHLGDSVGRVTLQRIGGGLLSHHTLQLTCGVDGLMHMRIRELPTGPQRLQLSWDPKAGTLACAFGSTRALVPVDFDDAGSWAVRLGPYPRGHGEIARAVIQSSNVRVLGGTVATPGLSSLDPSREAARLRESTWPLEQAEGLGRMQMASGADLGDVTLHELSVLLRRDPEVWLAHARAQRPDDWAVAFDTAWRLPLSYRTARSVAVLLDPGLADLDTADPPQRALRLLRTRLLLEADQDLLAFTQLRDMQPTANDDVWELRARLAALRGDLPAAREAVAQWRLVAKPTFVVDTIIASDEVFEALRR